jgi:hypothetical protein
MFLDSAGKAGHILWLDESLLLLYYEIFFKKEKGRLLNQCWATFFTGLSIASPTGMDFNLPPGR